jgi:hypothetical protein
VGSYWLNGTYGRAPVAVRLDGPIGGRPPARVMPAPGSRWGRTRWGLHPEGGVRVVVVLVLAPVLDEDLGLGRARDLLEVQQLVADADFEGEPPGSRSP